MKKLFHNFPEKILFFANYLLTAWVNLIGKKPVTPESILVVKWDEIGDMVTSLHVFSMLKKAYPQTEIEVLCKPVCKQLISNDPHISRIITNEKDWKKKYDIVVELRGTWGTLFKSLKYIPKYRVDRGTVRFKNKLSGEQVKDITTNTEIVRPLIGEVKEEMPRIFSSENDRKKVSGFLSEKQLNRFALFHATANKPLKEWSSDKFAALAEKLFAEYGLTSVFIGGPEEKERIEQIMSKLSHTALNIAGVFSLTELYELCKEAAIYVGNDSGPMHIANAAGTPLIGLFGPGPPHIFYPHGTQSRVVHHVLSCNPCDQIHCVRPEDPCIEMIQVKDVMKEVKELIK
jgi:ADP-heptose:LPS heptosyltransferase